MAISLKRAEKLVVEGTKLKPETRKYLRGRVKRECRNALDIALDNLQEQEKLWLIVGRLEGILEMDGKNKT